MNQESKVIPLSIKRVPEARLIPIKKILKLYPPIHNSVHATAATRGNPYLSCQYRDNASTLTSIETGIPPPEIDPVIFDIDGR